MEPSSSFEKISQTVARPVPAVNQDDVRPSGLVRAAGTVGIMTLASRVLGMIRDILSAQRFGTSWQWDAFTFAFMLPNFFRRLVNEGALSSAFIPIYSEILEKRGKEAAFRYANITGTVLAATLVVLMLGIELALNLILQADFLPVRIALAVELLRTFFPYLFFISLFALAMGILNCHRHFFTPALGPVILDLFWIAGLFLAIPIAGHIPENQLHALAAILLLSGVAQVAAEISPLLKMGFRFKWIPDFSDADLKRTGRLLLPAVLNFGVFQINLLLDSAFAFWAGPGANSALWYGNRLMQFPLGIFAIAIGTALLPELSSQAARGDHDGSRKTLSFALRGVFFLILPCTVGLIVLSAPIVRLLFERGEFDSVSTARTAAVVACYSIGLIGYSGQKIISTGFYAAQDLRTPVKIGTVALVANLVFNFLLVVPFREAGLALATSISGLLQFGILLFYYQRQTNGLPIRELALSFFKIAVVSIMMGGIALLTFKMTGSTLGSIAIAILSYAAFCFLFLGLRWPLFAKK